MDKLSELSKPVAWLAIYHGDVYDEAISITRSVVEAQADRFGWESALTEITPLYSQEYVSSLDKVAQFWIGESAGWKKRAEDAEKRLATPVRLPLPEQQNITCVLLDKRKVAAAIHTAGFKVKG